jgi:hypothetical protein
MAVSTNGECLDQFEEGNGARGHSEVAAIHHPAVSPPMTSRRFHAPWRAEAIPGVYIVRDAAGQAIAYTDVSVLVM